MPLSPKDLEALERASRLIRTPYALAALEALTNDEDPYPAEVDTRDVDSAVAVLLDLGAATVTPAGQLAATDRGRRLYHRLVEIEQGVNLPGNRETDS